MALHLFLESCTKSSLADLDCKDVLAFMTHMKKKGLASRTVANRGGFLKTFFLNHGLAWPLFKSERPLYTEKIVSAYDQQELEKLRTPRNLSAAVLLVHRCSGPGSSGRHLE